MTVGCDGGVEQIALKLVSLIKEAGPGLLINLFFSLASYIYSEFYKYTYIYI